MYNNDIGFRPYTIGNSNPNLGNTMTVVGSPVGQGVVGQGGISMGGPVSNLPSQQNCINDTPSGPSNTGVAPPRSSIDMGTSTYQRVD